MFRPRPRDLDSSGPQGIGIPHLLEELEMHISGAGVKKNLGLFVFCFFVVLFYVCCVCFCDLFCVFVFCVLLCFVVFVCVFLCFGPDP